MKNKIYISFIIISMFFISLICMHSYFNTTKENKVVFNTDEKPNNTQFNNYKNPRFGFFIDYPLEFVQGDPSENGDGATFLSKDGKSKLTTYGSNNVLYSSIEELYKFFLEHTSGYIVEKKISEEYFTIVSLDNNILTYQKVHYGPSSYNVLIFSYPQCENEKYIDALKHISNSFSPGDLSSAH